MCMGGGGIQQAPAAYVPTTAETNLANAQDARARSDFRLEGEAGDKKIAELTKIRQDEIDAAKGAKKRATLSRVVPGGITYVDGKNGVNPLNIQAPQAIKGTNIGPLNIPQ